MRTFGVVLAIALVAPEASADPKASAEVVALINKRDVASLKARSTLPVWVEDVWFPDAKCAEFSQSLEWTRPSSRSWSTASRVSG
jgi:hypothetical protein